MRTSWFTCEWKLAAAECMNALAAWGQQRMSGLITWCFESNWTAPSSRHLGDATFSVDRVRRRERRGRRRRLGGEAEEEAEEEAGGEAEEAEEEAEGEEAEEEEAEEEKGEEAEEEKGEGAEEVFFHLVVIFSLCWGTWPQEAKKIENIPTGVCGRLSL